MRGEPTLKAKYGMKKINRLIEMRGAKSVRVGVIKGTGEHPNAPGIPIALIAWWNEFGTRKNGLIHIPSRPFLRTTLREHGYYKEHLKKALQASLIATARFEHAEIVKPLKALGQEAAQDIQQKITDGPWRPNADSTIRKKSTTSGEKAQPLIESGKMRQSITWVLSDD